MSGSYAAAVAAYRAPPVPVAKTEPRVAGAYSTNANPKQPPCQPVVHNRPPAIALPRSAQAKGAAWSTPDSWRQVQMPPPGTAWGEAEWIAFGPRSWADLNPVAPWDEYGPRSERDRREAAGDWSYGGSSSSHGAGQLAQSSDYNWQHNPANPTNIAHARNPPVSKLAPTKGKGRTLSVSKARPNKGKSKGKAQSKDKAQGKFNKANNK